MLDIKYIRENAEAVKENCANRGVAADIDALLRLDEQRRQTLQQVEQMRAQRKQKSKSKPSDEEIAKMREAGEEIKEVEAELAAIMAKLEEIAYKVPNMVYPGTPIGKDETENKVVRKFANLPKFNFQPKEHWELGEKLGIIDTITATKVSGSRFAYLKGALVKLEFALVQYALDVLTDEKILKKIIKYNKLKVSSKPFLPVVPPMLIKPDVMHKMARLEPREERYHISGDDLYLVGSAEHTLGPMHMDTILKEEDLPIRYVGFSTAFRREAGSYGKDMKGILRVHQFDKVEMESFTAPEQGVAEQDFIVAIQEYLMQSLGIPYQVVQKCTGDMGAPDYREFDIEAWLPGQNRYRETHTADYMADYQSRRLNTKVKLDDGTIHFAHMNDATAFAISRTPIAIMENFQQADGSILVPKALQKYTGFKKI
ncbi:serine--tRNA ligase [Patescibacteria group bacterium]|nr:MAG: serine--tRNA ligase [Patescibacteria group bacterium]